MYIDKLSDIVNKYNNTYHSTIKMKPVDVTSSTSIEFREIFLDISKAFEKVWHEGLIFKLKTNGIDSDLLKLLINYLEYRKQRVVLNGQAFSWKKN